MADPQKPVNPTDPAAPAAGGGDNPFGEPVRPATGFADGDRPATMTPSEAVRPATATVLTDEEVKRKRFREQLVLLCYALFRNLRMYSVNNRVLERPVDLFSRTLGALLVRDRNITLSFVENEVFYNRDRLKFTEDELQRLRWMVNELTRIDVGEFIFAEPLDNVRTARAWDVIAKWGQAEINIGGSSGAPTADATTTPAEPGAEAPAAGQTAPAAPAGPAGATFAGLRQKLTAEFGGAVDVGEVKVLSHGGGGVDKEVDVRTFAYLAYARLLVYVKTYMVSLDRPPRLKALGRRIRRVIQDLVDACYRKADVVLGLSSIKEYEAYLPNHSTNVAVLSIALAARIGVKKAVACEIGLAAAMADIGLLRIPTDILNKKGKLSDEEWAWMKKHPELSVATILRSGQVSEATLRQAVVAFEHHMSWDGTGYPRLSNPETMDLFSRIVAITDTFDALTTNRPHRPALLPDEALREIMKGAGGRYDPALCKVFANMVGIFPLGSTVKLNTGEIAIVYLNNPDPERAKWPTVKILVDATGAVLDQGPMVDLASQTDGGQRAIQKCVDVAALGLNIPHYLLTV